VAGASDSQSSGFVEQQRQYLVVLGIAQDAGYPAAGCRRACCEPAWADLSLRRHVSCLGLVDPQTGGRWLIDCTPDYPAQLHALNEVAKATERTCPSGILLTHAHIGHYTGLIHLGREAVDALALPVYAMPRMRAFLEQNEPWRTLVKAGNVVLNQLQEGAEQALNENLTATPIAVPHRDELSETVGFIIRGSRRSALYIPDIDGWEQWHRSIEDLLATVDVSYLDGTFYSAGELGGRDMRAIPHPRIEASIARFASLPEEERFKVRFLHFNHTNPVLNQLSEETRSVLGAGHHLAVEGEKFEL